MATPPAENVDLGSLTPEQQVIAQQYVQVTDQNIEEAIPLLQRSQWNIQIAIAKFFDGEGPGPVAGALAAQDMNRAPPTYENLQESLRESSAPRRTPLSSRSDPAPRIVPPPQSVYRAPLLLTILFAPFTITYRVASTTLNTFIYLFTFLPAWMRPRYITNLFNPGLRGTAGRRMLLPRDTASRFIREFEEEYGANRLPWFQGGVAEAQDLAKKDLKFLLVVLVSPEHDDTESFLRETLLSPEVVSLITDPDNNMILWGGNVLDSEAYQASAEYNCTKFPFSALICLTPKEGSSTRMGIVKRLAGPMAPSKYLSELQAAMQKYSSDLAGVRAERAARDYARQILSEQDSAYERSLAQDRERARLRREAAEAAAQAERRAEEEAAQTERNKEKRAEWKRWRATTVPTEPGSSVKEAVRVALKLPESMGGSRIVRRFPGDSTMDDLYSFVECYDILASGDDVSGENASKPDDYEHKFQFRIASIMPRVIYEPSETNTMGEKIGRGGNLIVEDVEDEADE